AAQDLTTYRRGSVVWNAPGVQAFGCAIGRVPTGRLNSALGASECPRTVGGSTPTPTSADFEPSLKSNAARSPSANGRIGKLQAYSPGAARLKTPRPTVRLLIAMIDAVVGRFSDQTRRNHAPLA